MPQIKFSHNWNKKLDCDVFSTIRRHTNEKQSYYFKNIHNVFDVIFENAMIHCEAKLIQAFIYKLNELDPLLLMLDTGTKSWDDALKIFKSFGLKEDSKVLVLVFENLGEREA